MFLHWSKTIAIYPFARSRLFFLSRLHCKCNVSLISLGDVFWQGWYCLAKILQFFPGALSEREGAGWEAAGISEHERRQNFASNYCRKYTMFSFICIYPIVWEGWGGNFMRLKIRFLHLFIFSRNQLERIGEVVWMQCPFPWTTRSL